MSARGHVLEVLAGASAALGLERDYINDLNVYPVPDGDTGTNLFLTVQAIIDETEAAPVDDLPGLMAVVTRGSLMGARGNSGVILSQIVRGTCESIAAAQAFDAARTFKPLTAPEVAALSLAVATIKAHFAHKDNAAAIVAQAQAPAPAPAAPPVQG